MSSKALIGIRACCLAICLASPAAQAARVTLLAKNVYQNLFGIAVDSSGIYVTGSTGPVRDFAGTYTSGVVGYIPLTGGTVTTLFSKSSYPGSGHTSPMQIATDGAGHLYWADPDAGPSTGASFYEGSTAGGTPNQFFGICCGASVFPGDSLGVSLDVTTGAIFFSDMTGGRAGYFTSGSNTPVQIGATRYSPAFDTEAFSQIVYTNGKLFLADSGQDRSGTSTNVQVKYDESAYLAPAITWIAADGTGGFQTLSSGIIPSPQGITANGNLLYVTSGDTIWQVNEKTGATKVLVTDTHWLDLQGIAYYNGYLYVVDSNNKFGAFSGGVSTATEDLKGKVWSVKL
jgi:hypothetical protein